MALERERERERELVNYHNLSYNKAIMLAIIWPEIVKKRYHELCHNIYRGSLLYRSDSVNVMFQHMLRLGSL